MVAGVGDGVATGTFLVLLGARPGTMTYQLDVRGEARRKSNASLTTAHGILMGCLWLQHYVNGSGNGGEIATLAVPETGTELESAKQAAAARVLGVNAEAPEDD